MFKSYRVIQSGARQQVRPLGTFTRFRPALAAALLSLPRSTVTPHDRAVSQAGVAS